ncbi:E3 ubiquitin-protein ligase MIB1 [Octopus bimaculoides]|nr:E3 ubiquitin-protein ligase MIB1 [Octopus bimaculoides]
MLNLQKEERLSGTIVAMYLGHSKGNFHHKNKCSKTPVDLIENSEFKKKIEELFPSLCLLCKKKEPIVEFQPCEHTVICRNCYKNENELKTCPKCQRAIETCSIPVDRHSGKKEVQTTEHPSESKLPSDGEYKITIIN